MTILRHVVFMGFNASSSAQEIAELEQGFSTLAQQVPEVIAFEWGSNNSPEGLNDGYSHCFLLSFASEADRNAYLPHPLHQAFVSKLKPHLAKVCVLDYWQQVNG